MFLIYATKTCCHDVVTTPQIPFVTSINPQHLANAKLNGQTHLPGKTYVFIKQVCRYS